MISTFSAPSRAVQEHSIRTRQIQYHTENHKETPYTSMATHLGAVPCTNHTPQAAKQLLQKNYKHQSVTPRGKALRGCSGTHCKSCWLCCRKGRSDIWGGWVITFGVYGADTDKSVQGGLIHWAQPEEVVAEQGSGREWSRLTVDTHM